MNECPYCDAEVKDKFQFCPVCDRRIKCSKCGDLLLSGKDKCYVCGEPIRTENGSDGANTFRVEEEQDENSFQRTISIEVSDEGIQEAVRIADHFFGGRANQRYPRDFASEKGSRKALPMDGAEVEGKAGDGLETNSNELDEQDSSENESEKDGLDSGEHAHADIDIRRLNYNYEKIMLALYDLTERTGTQDSAAPTEVYDHLEDQYGRNSLSKKSVQGSISHAKHRNVHFEKTDDSRYYLTVEGVKKVKGWLKNGYESEEG